MRWILFILLSSSSLAWADDPPAGAVVLQAGEAAPRAGILLTEAQADRAMELRIELEETKVRLSALESAAEGLENELTSCRGRAGERCNESWWCRNGVVVGIVVGAVGAGLAVWGAVSVLEARR